VLAVSLICIQVVQSLISDVTDRQSKKVHDFRMQQAKRQLPDTGTEQAIIERRSTTTQLLSGVRRLLQAVLCFEVELAVASVRLQ
jgi:hypothetical protein